MRSAYLSPAQFRALAQDDCGKAKGALVRATFSAEAKAAGESREIQFTISTASIDRMGDTIAVDGWKLDAYRKNPVVLWGHDSSSLPVGRATRVWAEGQALKATAEFTPVGMARFNDTVFDMIKAGFLSAVSVGFMPLKWAFAEDPARRYGVDFIEQELLEFSVVSIPANPEALIDPGERAAAAATVAAIVADAQRGALTREEAEDQIAAAIGARARAAARSREIELLALAGR